MGVVSKILSSGIVPPLLSSDKRLCPFMSDFQRSESVVENSDGTTSIEEDLNLLYHECIQEKCQLWDGSRCSVFNTTKRSDNMDVNLTNLNSVISHWHRSHLHCASHYVENLSVGGGRPLTCSSNIIPYSSELVLEYMCNEDMDGNGKIYGRDFGIMNDGNKPAMLVNMELGLADWKNPPKMVTWNSLYKWRKSSGSNPL